jgi:hypothetical protein
MNNLVYLAGGIAGLAGYDAIDWRQYAAQELHNYDIDVRDPMRAKSVLGGTGKISTNFNDYKDLGIFFTSRGIMTRDFNDVKQADVLLVNLLDAEKPSLGTIVELAWAFAMQKPAVVCIEEKGNPHDNHPMIHECMPFRVTTLDDGIYAVAVILGKV